MLAWQGLEYVGVLLTGTLASLWGASAAAVGSAVVISLVLLTISVLRRTSCAHRARRPAG